MNQELKNINKANIILAVLLVAALISGSILFWEHLRVQGVLRISEEKLLDINENLIPSKDEQIDDIQNRLKMAQSDLLNLKERNASYEAELKQLREKNNDLLINLDELQGLKEQVSELDQMIIAKTRSISQLEGKIAVLSLELEGMRKDMQSLEAELSSKDSLLASLEDEVAGKESDILSLNEEIKNNNQKIKRLQSELADYRGKKEMVEGEMGQMKSTYDKLVSDLRAQIKNREVAIETFKENISVTFVDSILFDSGKAIISEEGGRILKKVGEPLKEVKDRDIQIIGHTDDVPIMKEYRYKFPTNWELSTARAAAVARYFQDEIGLDPWDLEAVGRSCYQPVANNETAEGRAKNRRVNIIIGPKKR